ncbi:hypothetical protein KVR01_005483 [Diaporthe batatas]|uniref:uncharacterized protein n=1 Tax=Diaporthe batatas TaxID=748121 RepID=UPI001D056F5A|nr:uncharacterized protein KVR01_005483 [Diaporthe batatas]KAG8165208.1 hypothetical protein KVR01_005483 [Diaporthe batatas]
MPGKKRPAVDDGDSSEGEINVEQVIKTKAELDEIRKDRDKKRAQIQADLDKKLEGVRTRIEQTAQAHIRQLADVYGQQVEELFHATRERDSILQQIKAKLSELQERACDLDLSLHEAYAYRMKKLEGVTMPMVDRPAQNNIGAKADGA